MLNSNEIILNSQTDSQQTGLHRLAGGFARFMVQHYAPHHPQKHRIHDLLSQLSQLQFQGHSCMPLENADIGLLLDSGIASDGNITKPIVIDHQRAYLHRYWQYEQRLARQLVDLTRAHVPYQATELLDHFFADSPPGDRQREAAHKALHQRLTIITGGPGTGKTTTVARILGLLISSQPDIRHIALCAPTGKAAMRLQESLHQQTSHLPIAPQLQRYVPRQVTTIHQLLGAQPPSPYFRHHRQHPLPHDLVVVDETSMVDLALMSKLVDALKPSARLILLGDRQQLASVETGAVLSELSESLTDHTIELTHSHRFQGPIKALADAVNQQDSELAWTILQNSAPELEWINSELDEWVFSQYADYFQQIANHAAIRDIFQAFNRFRILCSNRFGHNSASDLNTRLEKQLSSRLQWDCQTGFYAGKPILVTSNQPALAVYNGDIGICLAHPHNANQLAIALPTNDGSFRWLHTSQLSSFETAYAMTIHKSQGSEFEQVLLSLPEHPNPVLSKELLYTGITRARRQVSIACLPDIFAQCIHQRASRDSGLAQQISRYQKQLS